VKQSRQGLDGPHAVLMPLGLASHPCRACFTGARTLIAPAFRHTSTVQASGSGAASELLQRV
jgi:hypothetical protein